MKKILLITDNDLLQMGIQRLIKTIVKYTVHKAVSQDEEEIIRHIEEDNAEVIIIDGSLDINGSKLVTRLLRIKRPMRLLIMRIDSNHVQIIDKREVSLEQIADLSAFI